MEKTYKKTARILLGIFALQACLLATHLGEFWPFSIYPMFSKAGQTWTRALAKDVTAISPELYWHQPSNLQQLSGKPFALDEINIHQNDISNLLFKVKIWDDKAKETIKHLFSPALEKGKKIMVYKVNGSLSPNESADKQVQFSYTPFILLTKDAAILSPQISKESD